MTDTMTKSGTVTKPEDSAKTHDACMLNRRRFLLYSGAGAAAVGTITIGLFPGVTQAARVVGYPRKKIATLSSLRDHEPKHFDYPDTLSNSSAMIVKMEGIPAGGGIGPKQDVVAFSTLCTHQGGPLQGTYKHVGDQRILGQCPFHLSTFDLRRHGIIVSGQAYNSLPQVVLEIEGDDIYAVGLLGLIFGRNENLIEKS
uniref:Arsenite oxidase small subunit n=1 Tax=Candidatus Kentrum sp. LFY TaxID=2126342 RepID=A0A450UNX9_9GAMM|nr:MAG: arsenite oxidase small subunit [Candidatus Kentron sp. LFY]